MRYTSATLPAIKRSSSTYSLLHYVGRSGDHNDKAMQATPILAKHLSNELNMDPTVIGKPENALNRGWEEELKAALPNYKIISEKLDQVLNEGKKPIIALSRCSVALATLPIIAKHYPDIIIVWFDAHGDLNTPSSSDTGFLGGMALSGPIGLWESWMKGKKVKTENELLRTIDNIEEGRKRIFIHLDCDVLNPGIVPTDYKVPGGLSIQQLKDAISGLSESSDVIGIQISELEFGDSEKETQDAAKLLVDSIKPVLC
ncbi:uncharacterized protein I206_105915 [Kwoniella pini CBS 10737]|uniref:Arginase n=1 Tax=Kwoniella pini CBS 10737 TaxID=1296096 RepID=A0A1B9I0T0_9TREE|nr:uncharacterized protein I206_04738 [Kwoniella pini CBS 10737]OCF49051.1 hypothetical protein I206_04738 [Kwoniella pini CBS 10737]